MTKVTYVVTTKDGSQCEIVSYGQAIEMIGKYGGTITPRYSKVVTESSDKKYVGKKPKKKYIPPYHGRLYAQD